MSWVGQSTSQDMHMSKSIYQLNWSISLSGNLSMSAQMRVPLYKEAQNLCFMLLKENYVIMKGLMIVIYFSEPAPTPGESGWGSCTVTRSTTFSEIHSTRAEDSRRFESWRSIFGKLKKCFGKLNKYFWKVEDIFLESWRICLGKLKKYFWKVEEIFLELKEIFLKRWRNNFGKLKKCAKIIKINFRYDVWITFRYWKI